MTAYVVGVCVFIRKIPNSLSQSVLAMPPWGRYLWMAVMMSVAFLLEPVFIMKSSDNTQFLAYFACAGLLFVGAAPLVPGVHKDDSSYPVHMVGAYVAAIASQLDIAINQPPFMLLWLPVLGVLAWHWHQKWSTAVFWGEITCLIISFMFCMY